MNDVYTQPETILVFERTGEFPDGAILVKELVCVDDNEATSGNGYFISEFIGLEDSVKDESGNCHAGAS